MLSMKAVASMVALLQICTSLVIVSFFATQPNSTGDSISQAPETARPLRVMTAVDSSSTPSSVVRVSSTW